MDSSSSSASSSYTNCSTVLRTFLFFIIEVYWTDFLSVKKFSLFSAVLLGFFCCQCRQIGWSMVCAAVWPLFNCCAHAAFTSLLIGSNFYFYFIFYDFDYCRSFCNFFYRAFAILKCSARNSLMRLVDFEKLRPFSAVQLWFGGGGIDGAAKRIDAIIYCLWFVSLNFYLFIVSSKLCFLAQQPNMLKSESSWEHFSDFVFGQEWRFLSCFGALASEKGWWNLR